MLLLYHLIIFFQGIVGGMTLSLLYYSFRELPLGDATTIIFSSPVIVIALSFVFLKEPCGVLRITVICALFAGVVFVARPPFLFQVNEIVMIIIDKCWSLCRTTRQIHNFTVVLSSFFSFLDTSS